MEEKKEINMLASPWFWGVLMVIVFIIALAVGGGDKEDKLGKANPDLKVPVSALSLVYAANTANADDKLKGKYIEVTGIVDYIGVSLGKTNVTLKGTGKNDSYRVFCIVDEKDEVEKVLNMVVGQEVTMVGKCDGLFLDIILKNCDVVR